MPEHTFQPGDVVHYTPADRWCHEGIAIARERFGCVVLFDTYWGSYQPRALTDAEAATAELAFRLDDYDELQLYSSHANAAEWEKYAPADRQLITSQHGLQKRWFIRKGAVEDWPTKIANAQAVVDDAVAALNTATSRLRWAQEELERVRAAAAEEVTR